jgi:hypothetical protein
MTWKRLTPARLRRTALTIGLALLVAIGATTYVFFLYLPTFVTSDRPFDAYCARADAEPSPVEGRLSVIFVDGLSFDYAKKVPELAWLRDASATRPLAVPYPSYTTPALLNFVTGLDPRDSGVRLNATLTDVTGGLDNLTAVARDAGRPINYFGGGFASFGATTFAHVIHRGHIATEVAPFLVRQRLTMSYFGAVDEAGHVSGEDSQEFRDQTRRAAVYLWRHWSMLDPSKDRMLVVSDHGHLPSGGHGGIERSTRRALFAIAGKDVKPAVELEQRPLRDVASTIAVLSGLKTPACNTGRPMLDTLTWSDVDKARALASPFQQSGRLLSQLASNPAVEPTVDALKAGNEEALQQAPKLLDAWRAEYDRTHDGSVHNLRRIRIFAFIGALLIALLYWRKKLRLNGSEMLKRLAPPAAVFGIYNAFLLLRGYRLTFSKMPPQQDFLLDAAMGAAIAVALVSATLIVRNKTRAAHTALFAGVLPWLGCAIYSGYATHAVAPPHAGLLVFLWGPSAIAAAITAVVVRVAEHRLGR